MVGALSVEGLDPWLFWAVWIAWRRVGCGDLGPRPAWKAGLGAW
jgi:hypothetical protein